MSRRANQHKI